MPDIYQFEHPRGSIIGQAKLGEYLVVCQWVSMAGDLTPRYSELGDGVALFAKPTVIGLARVNSYCPIAALAQFRRGAVL